jgi:cobalt/nickel transport system permease protein
MADLNNSLYNIRLMDDLARKDTLIHRIHPVMKLLTTIAYLVTVISYDRYEIINMLPLILYPILVFELAELPVKPILKRVLFGVPFIIGIGILNPLFEREIFSVGGIFISKGWITFTSIVIKSSLTITAGLLLISVTGMDKLSAALRMLKVPRIFVLQLLLTYRYISVLLEEAARIVTAYNLRTPKYKGIERSAWGSLTGQLLIRTLDRAERVYEAMCLRGFNGEYNTGADSRISVTDVFYLLIWILFFAAASYFNLPVLLGRFMTGVIG